MALVTAVAQVLSLVWELVHAGRAAKGGKKNAECDSLGVRWGLRWCISHKLPHDADVLGPWGTL